MWDNQRSPFNIDMTQKMVVNGLVSPVPRKQEQPPTEESHGAGVKVGRYSSLSEGKGFEVDPECHINSIFELRLEFIIPL